MGGRRRIIRFLIYVSCLAVVVAGLTAAPAAPARAVTAALAGSAATAAAEDAAAAAAATAVTFTDPGGDLVTSVADGSVDSASLQEAISSLETMLGLPAGADVGSLMAALWQKNSAAPFYFPEPTVFTGGTLTISGSTLTVDVPRDAIPVTAAWLSASLAGFAAGLIGFAVCIIATALCLLVVGAFTFPTPFGPVADAICWALGFFLWTFVGIILTTVFQGKKRTPDQWKTTAVFAATNALAGLVVPFVGKFYKWIVPKILATRAGTWVTNAIDKLKGWFGSSAGEAEAGAGAALEDAGNQATPAAMDDVLREAGLDGNTATGTITNGTSTGNCLDAYGANGQITSSSQIVAINTCNGNQNQNWEIVTNGNISVLGMCMDTGGGTSSLGGRLVNMTMCDGASSQVWTQSGNTLVNKATGDCLDDPNANTAPGTQLQIWPCNGTPAQAWILPQPPPNGSSCDLYAFYGTPCVAAYSMTRALYAGYGGPLYQVQRASDGTTANIGLLSAGGYVNASEQDSFCAGTTCTITELYDQSPDGNNLTIGGPGGPGCSSAPGYSCLQADHGADASLAPVTVHGTTEAYGLDITGGVGYADTTTRGVAVNDQPEGMYMVASGTNVNGQCCMDFGNAETNRFDNGNGHMDAVRIGTGVGIPGTCWFPPCNGSGPWVGVDMENGTFLGANGSYLGNTPIPDNFVTAMAKNDGQTAYAIRAGNAQAGGLTTEWDGALPNIGGYMPMQKEGAIVLGTGGDNSNAGIGTWFEGVMTAGYPSERADYAVQANIVAADYAGNSAGHSVSGNSAAGTAGQAVLHDGYTSVYTVDASNGHLQETYLAAICAPNCAPGQGWATQDLSATVGTPPVAPGTSPGADYHDGYTSVYTVDAANGHLQETFLA